MAIDRVLIHLDDRRRRSVDPADVYVLEADGDETLVRLHGRRRLRDVRSLGELLPAFRRHGFVRLHASYAANARRILEIRPRDNERDWEVKMEPPVNAVLPVSRQKLKGLMRVFGEED